MELIEILWRQDIDLGVERDADDLKQRQLERQKESQLNQTLAKVRSHTLWSDPGQGTVIPTGQTKVQS